MFLSCAFGELRCSIRRVLLLCFYARWLCSVFIAISKLLILLAVFFGTGSSGFPTQFQGTSVLFAHAVHCMRLVELPFSNSLLGLVSAGSVRSINVTKLCSTSLLKADTIRDIPITDVQRKQQQHNRTAPEGEAMHKKTNETRKKQNLTPTHNTKGT